MDREAYDKAYARAKKMAEEAVNNPPPAWHEAPFDEIWKRLKSKEKTTPTSTSVSLRITITFLDR